MEKQDNYSAAAPMATSFAEADYSAVIQGSSSSAPTPNGFASGPSYMMERPFSDLGDALQYADMGPRLALHGHQHDPSHGMMRYGDGGNYFGDEEMGFDGAGQLDLMGLKPMMASSDPGGDYNAHDGARGGVKKSGSGKRKRARSVKTNEEAENQRMTHIAVERNRRKQMNEHLRVLRALMPNSYVQRGDQASIVGGAIEFVRELEQLIQCLESQKRRRLSGEDDPPFDPRTDQIINVVDDEDVARLMGSGPGPAVGVHEETAENKSVIADVEVKVMGLDAFIKILSRRRPGQLIKVISALQDLECTILHTNITTIEQTALYSFNVKIGGDARVSAEDIAGSVQTIFTFIHANSAV